MSEEDFGERIDFLLEQVGEGDLELSVEFDQVYAAPQERGFWETGPNAGVRIRNHPRGGGSHFLRDAMVNGVDQHMEHLAAVAIMPNGSDLRGGAVDVAGNVRVDAEGNAPVEFVNLARSGHEIVTDNGVVVHDRPADVPRLSREQLKHQRSHPDTDFGKDTRQRL